jgi:DDE superfamily endonuclease
MDDTLLPKSGIRIPGVAYRRDPLGPPFRPNFIRAQRFLQLSAALPLNDGAYRMLPIGFVHAPPARKPSKKATLAEIQDYKQAAKTARLPLVAVQQLSALRQQLDTEPGGADRWLHAVVDNGFVNTVMFRGLPPRTALIGRIRKDAKLYFLPETSSSSSKHAGRPRHYGALAPTPEQLLANKEIPFEEIDLAFGSDHHCFRVKRLTHLLWRTAGLNYLLQLIVIAPLGYRLRKGSKVLYRRPAFLICTDPELDRRNLVAEYIQRWDIEVNFREEKTLLGVGQAQVRNSASVQAVPAFQVASYSLLLLATLLAFRQSADVDLLPRPKWARPGPQRFTTADAINQLRAELWGRALGIENLSDFANQSALSVKPEKFLPPLASAAFYAMN